MDVKILNEFESGRSGAKVYLAEKDGIIGVYKTNVKNPLKVFELSKRIPFLQPEIYDYNHNSIFMEYIDGIMMREVLREPSISIVSHITDYILSYIDFSLSTSSGMYDFSDTINNKILSLGDKVDIRYFKNIKTVHPFTVTHGDFTFDNLIYKDGKIYMIDLSPTDFNSIHFDMNKFRQDLSGLWFVRNQDNKHLWRPTCDTIYKNIQLKYPDLFDDATYNLMISRIIPYCSNNEFDRQFVLNSLISV